MPISQRGQVVLHGLLDLDSSERQLVLDELSRYARGDSAVRKSISESIDRAVTLGPVSSGCPCCGR